MTNWVKAKFESQSKSFNAIANNIVTSISQAEIKKALIDQMMEDFKKKYDNKNLQDLKMNEWKALQGTESWNGDTMIKIKKHLKNSNNTNKRELGQGISVILSKKGPLLINEEKEFASLPPRTSFESVTLEQALEAYLAKGGTEIGLYLDSPIKKKKGPYGFYAEWTTIKVPLKAEDTGETIIEKIKKKQEPGQPTFCRIVGDFTIKQGPYGLYFFKHTLKTVKFITLPKSADKDSVTAEDLVNFYKTAPVKKKFIKKKDKEEG